MPSCTESNSVHAGSNRLEVLEPNRPFPARSPSSSQFEPARGSMSNPLTPPFQRTRQAVRSFPRQGVRCRTPQLNPIILFIYFLYYSLSGALLRFTFVVQLLPGQPAGRPPARRLGPGSQGAMVPGPAQGPMVPRLRAGGRPAGWPGNSWTTKVNRNRAPERE